MMKFVSRLIIAATVIFIAAPLSEAQLCERIKARLLGGNCYGQRYSTPDCVVVLSDPGPSPTPNNPCNVVPPQTCEQQYTQDKCLCDFYFKNDPVRRAECMQIVEARRRRCPPVGAHNPRALYVDPCTKGPMSKTAEQCLDDYRLCMSQPPSQNGYSTEAERNAQCEDIFFQCLRLAPPPTEDPPPEEYCCSYTTPVVCHPPTTRRVPLLKRLFGQRCR